ncbi:poly(A) polymerase isoform X1 [Spatholobus suberectus]|nr:poly(A) polymerase isoform X1 [Spatholobus suberectus]
MLCSDSQELRNVESNYLSNSGQDELDRTESPEPASNSSVITSVTSDGGSSEDIGSVSGAGGVEDSTRGVEMMNNGRFEDTTYGNVSVTLAKNIVASGNEVLHELQEQLQPNAMLGMVLDSTGNVLSEAVQEPVIRRMSLASTV